MTSVKVKTIPLCGKTVIDRLFAQGQSVVSFPFRGVFQVLSLEDKETQIEFLVSIPKKKFKRAVHRNLLRRRTKEAFRLNKGLFADLSGIRLQLSIIYTDIEKHSYARIEPSIVRLIEKINQRIEKQTKKALSEEGGAND